MARDKSAPAENLPATLDPADRQKVIHSVSAGYAVIKPNTLVSVHDTQSSLIVLRKVSGLVYPNQCNLPSLAA